MDNLTVELLEHARRERIAGLIARMEDSHYYVYVGHLVNLLDRVKLLSIPSYASAYRLLHARHRLDIVDALIAQLDAIVL